MSYDDDTGLQLLTIGESSRILKETYRHTWERTRKGEIETVKIGNRAVRIPLSALKKFLADRTVPAKPQDTGTDAPVAARNENAK